MEGKYIGKNGILGFKKGHSYIINIEKPKDYTTYILTSEYDITEDEKINLAINYASQISIKQNWKIKEETIDKV